MTVVVSATTYTSVPNTTNPKTSKDNLDLKMPSRVDSRYTVEERRRFLVNSFENCFDTVFAK